MKSFNTFYLLYILSIILNGCSEIKTNDPEHAFNYWIGNEHRQQVQVLEGKYWESSHLSKEYIVYLKIKPSKLWWSDYKYLNGLQVSKGDWIKPEDIPDWFQPSANSIIYQLKNENSESRYFENEENGICYVYEIQL